MDQSGVVAGWPRLDRRHRGGAGLRVGREGRCLVAVGMPRRRVRATLHTSTPATARWTAFRRPSRWPCSTSTWGDTGGCSPTPPVRRWSPSDGTGRDVQRGGYRRSPLTSRRSIPDDRWPYRPARPLVRRDERYVKEDAYCPSARDPRPRARQLRLPADSGRAHDGGRRKPRRRRTRMHGCAPGWPVELKRRQEPSSGRSSVGLGRDRLRPRRSSRSRAAPRRRASSPSRPTAP